MSEDNTESLNGSETNPTPFEEFVRQHLDMIVARMDRIEKEMIERFVQLSRQGIEMKEQLCEVKDELAKSRVDIRDIDLKLDAYVRESMRIKRDLYDLQESLGPKN